jgi:hypothetical protein
LPLPSMPSKVMKRGGMVGDATTPRRRLRSSCVR